ncbi:MAG: 3-oxoacyl-[acyl-carrier-protein] reductase [Chloroflexota bacterium]|nr:3-oxoacyl-[acyl-carrier-protein] reductase [Chloroflexota bacterium]MDE2919543.1 3-oxoacyl-[acyl-carrier-protein] reductase [Chloroflexota bacterium]
MGSVGRLTGARTLVTGASGALGRAFARRLATEGADLVLHYNSNAKQADELASEIRSNGGSAIVIGADLSTVEGAEMIVDQAQDALGGLDVLVNNAGTTRDNLLMRMSDEQWDTVMNTNLRSAFVCSRRAVRGMIRQRSGRIINITSVVGLRGNAGQANYAAAKAGLIGFTRALAQEVGSRGITVNAVAPGFVISPLTDVIPDKLREKALSGIPLGRFADPDDIAGSVVFLASDDGAYVTGHVLTVDGGLAMG